MTVIAMTGETGSLGNEVAAGVAAKLGLKIIRFEDVVHGVARRLGVAPGAVLRYADGRASFLERWKIDRRRLFHYTAEEVLRLAQRDDILVKGWGAATLLRDMPDVVSVRVCAPMTFRVRVLMERHGIGNANARAWIEHDDDARARTMRAPSDVAEDDARRHHIVLNTALLPVEACVKTVVELVESRRCRNIAAIRSALADKLVEARIGAAFAEQISPSMAPLGVQVSVADGKITLAGTSCSGSLRRRAEAIAQMVAGAFAIDNRIVSVPSHGRM